MTGDIYPPDGRGARQQCYALVSLMLFAAAAGGVLSGCPPGDRCSIDDDCSGDSVCEEGSCIDPDWRVGGDTSPETGDEVAGIEVPDEVRLTSAAIDERAEETVDLRNGGDAPLRIGEVFLEEGTAFSVEVPDGSTPLEIEPGSSRSLRVVYEPIGAEQVRDTLVVESNDPDQPTAEIELVGSVDDGFGGPCVERTPEDAVEFGSTNLGDTATKTVELKNCSSSQPLRIDRVEVDPGTVFASQIGGQVSVAPGETHRQEVRFTPEEPTTYSATLKISTNVPGPGDMEIPLRGEGSTPEDCPTARAKAALKDASDPSPSKNLEVAPRTTVALDGSESTSPDGSVDQFEWTILDRPSGSTAQLTRPGAAEPEMFLDLAGSYRFELVVYAADGTASCNKSVVDVTAKPSSEIYVELVWDTPDDGDQTDGVGTDLELHYLHPKASSWNEAPWDIYWDNKSADWGAKNRGDDDPTMVATERNGAGPETLSHPNPVDGNRYTVGVYYYDDADFGESFATTRIHINGNLEREFPGKLLKQFWFWRVALIDWPSGNILERDEINKSGFP